LWYPPKEFLRWALDSILSANNGGAVSQIAKQLGIPENAAKQATSALTPALSRGLERNAEKPGGFEDLLGALTGGKHEKYVDEPEVLGKQESIDDGNAILGHIFGSKDVEPERRGRGLSADGHRRRNSEEGAADARPVVMGMLSKQTKSGGGGVGLGDLTKILGGGGDNGFTDQLLDLAKRYT
jgi:hypothetical protein